MLPLEGAELNLAVVAVVDGTVVDPVLHHATKVVRHSPAEDPADGVPYEQLPVVSAWTGGQTDRQR